MMYYNSKVIITKSLDCCTIVNPGIKGICWVCDTLQVQSSVVIILTTFYENHVAISPPPSILGGYSFRKLLWMCSLQREHLP